MGNVKRFGMGTAATRFREKLERCHEVAYAARRRFETIGWMTLPPMRPLSLSWCRRATADSEGTTNPRCAHNIAVSVSATIGVVNRYT